MTKTTHPSAQLELPIMVDLRLRVESRAGDRAIVQTRPSSLQANAQKLTNEATSGDLSVYDAISANYSRHVK